MREEGRAIGISPVSHRCEELGCESLRDVQEADCGEPARDPKQVDRYFRAPEARRNGEVEFAQGICAAFDELAQFIGGRIGAENQNAQSGECEQMNYTGSGDADLPQRRMCKGPRPSNP